jgi:hypothetical protein
MRLALRVEHRGAADGSLTHLLFARTETLELARRSEALRADWPALMAMLACQAGDDDSEWRTGRLVVPGVDAPRLPPSSASPAPFVHYYTPLTEQQGYAASLDGPLYTWVVAPRPQGG